MLSHHGQLIYLCAIFYKLCLIYKKSRCFVLTPVQWAFLDKKVTKISFSKPTDTKSYYFGAVSIGRQQITTAVLIPIFVTKSDKRTDLGVTGWYSSVEMLPSGKHSSGLPILHHWSFRPNQNPFHTPLHSKPLRYKSSYVAQQKIHSLYLVVLGGGSRIPQRNPIPKRVPT